MNKRLNTLFAFGIYIAVFFLAGDAICQQKNRRKPKSPEPAKTNSLSRARAAELISAYPEFKSSVDIKVLVGSVWEDGMGDYSSGGRKFLADQGIITITKTGQKRYGRFTEYVIELTQQGEEAAKAWDKSIEKVDFDSLGLVSSNLTVYRVVIAEKRLIEVTGIAISDGGKSGRVEFNWKWAATSNAKLSNQIPSDAVHQSHAYLQLYDDGWRVVDPFVLYEL
jgi:hypothetical protein